MGAAFAAPVGEDRGANFPKNRGGRAIRGCRGLREDGYYIFAGFDFLLLAPEFDDFADDYRVALPHAGVAGVDEMAFFAGASESVGGNVGGARTDAGICGLVRGTGRG